MKNLPVAASKIVIPPHVLHWLNWVAFLLALAWLATVASTISTTISDFKQYWQAAVNIYELGDPYATTPQPGVTLDPALQHLPAFPYPPLLAYILLPIGQLPAETGLRIWFGLNIAMLAGLIALCIRLSHSPIVHRWWGGITLLTTLAPPTRLSLQLGQVSILLAFLAISTFWAAQRRGAFAGIILAIGSLIKLYPGFLGLYFLRSGQRRIIWWALGAGSFIVAISLLLHGPMPYQGYLRKVLLGGFYPYAAEFNISLVGFFQRLLVPSPFAIPIGDMPLLANGLAIIAALAVLTGCWLVGSTEGGYTTSLLRYATYLCAMLLLSPVNGIYNLVALLFPAVAGMRALELQPNPHLRLWLILGLALTWIQPGWSIGRPFYEWIHTGWAILLLSPSSYGLVIVFIVMVLLARQTSSKE